MGRLTNYLSLWLEKDGVDHSVDGIKDLLLLSQFEQSCSQDLVAHFKLSKVRSVHEMKTKAEAHFAAYGSEAYKLKKAKDDGKKSQHQKQSGRQTNQSGTNQDGNQQNAGNGNSGGRGGHQNYGSNYSNGGLGFGGGHRGSQGRGYSGGNQDYSNAYGSSSQGYGDKGHGNHRNNWKQDSTRAAASLENQQGSSVCHGNQETGVGYQASGVQIRVHRLCQSREFMITKIIMLVTEKIMVVWSLICIRCDWDIIKTA